MQKHFSKIFRLASFMLALSFVTVTAPHNARAVEKPDTAIERDCFWQLTKGNGDKIKCDFPVRMTAEELRKVQEITRGVLKDAHCNMTVNIDRSLIQAAMENADHIFEPPAQPVVCNIMTSKKDFSLNMHFKPRVVFKDGKAIEATPGMGAEARATRVISWPVRKWVNSSAEIEDAMVRIINAYLQQYRK